MGDALVLCCSLTVGEVGVGDALVLQLEPLH